MDIVESHFGMPEVHINGGPSFQTFESLHLPFIAMLLFAGITFFLHFVSGSSSKGPLLPTFDPERLVAVPTSPRGKYVYLDQWSRQLVVSPTPLAPPTTPRTKRGPRNKLKKLLRTYRPLGPLPEAPEETSLPLAFVV